MAKCILSFLLAVLLISPLSKNEITVCKNGKSQGEFFLSSSVPSGFDGVSFNLTEKKLAKLLDKYGCEKVHEYSADGVQNVYYYSKKISKIEVVSNKKVNFHVAKANGKITVGVPFIYYGY